VGKRKHERTFDEQVGQHKRPIQCRQPREFGRRVERGHIRLGVHRYPGGADATCPGVEDSGLIIAAGHDRGRRLLSLPVGRYVANDQRAECTGPEDERQDADESKHRAQSSARIDYSVHRIVRRAAYTGQTGPPSNYKVQDRRSGGILHAGKRIENPATDCFLYPMTFRGTTKRATRWLKTGGITAAGALGLLILLFWLALRDPGWYQPMRVPEEESQQVRDELHEAAQQFSDALMTTGRFQIHLRDSQINRWIAMRKEIYPLIDKEIPPHWVEPTVNFLDGVIRLAVRHKDGTSDIVVSVDLAVGMEEDTIALRLAGARIGSLRVPLTFLSGRLKKPIRIDGDKAWSGSPAMRGELLGGLHVDALAVWPNGEREYRVHDVRVEPGRLHLEIESLGPHYPKRRKDHTRESAPPRRSS
jgi:hypothetical protein